MKKEFFEYIGPADSLHTYVRSYKLVLLKCFFELMDASGCALAYDVSKKFKDFYVKRVENGRIPDVQVEPRIENITQSSVQDIYNVILSNPFKYISEKGFLLKRTSGGEKEQFYLPPQLVQELTAEDLQELNELIEDKIELYYSKIDSGGNMREYVEKFITEYVPAKQSQFAGHPFENYIRKTVPQIIYDTGIVDEENYLITGSAGKGNWATVPWVCIFDRQITTSATKGVYIVYLLSKDGNTLYLTFNQGCTEISQQHSKRETIEIMRKKANEIVSKIDSRGFLSDQNASLGEGLTQLADFYEKGIIFYKAYNKGSIPSEEELQNDLKNMMNIYKEYALSEQSKTSSKMVKERFRDWFAEKPQKNNSSIKYSSSTIDAAIRLLESGMSKLEITKYTNLNCFDITDYSEFKIVRDECYKLAEEFDKKQFHGDFRNGLDFYLMFLKEIAQFKELLEIFVRQLKINNDILEGEKIYGQGYRDMPKIQNIYKHCREFDGYILELNLQAGYNAYNSSNYINLRETWINVVPVFKEIVGGKHDVTALQVVIKPDNNIISDYQAKTVTDLGLFDSQSPNKTLIGFFDGFKKEIDKYLNESTNNGLIFKKKVDQSLLKAGTTIPQDKCDILLEKLGISLEKGERKDIEIRIGEIFYPAILTHVNFSEKYSDRDTFQIRYSEKSEIADKLRQVFEYSNSLMEDEMLSAKKTEKDEYIELYVIDENKVEFKCYPINEEEGEKEMTIKEQINAIEAYIAAKGFNYDGNLVENFYLSLKSKPFVILAGTSGTGKTKLVNLFAEAIGAKVKIVPVRPDWSDSSDLFGHIDLSGNFKPGAIIDFIRDASKYPDKPFILCLDEMNLARVEYYMSDILSVIETREFDTNHKITSKEPLVGENDCRCSNGINNYGEIRFPGNLYIVGNVNMDETTFPFSKKVLDRANTIEFSYVDLEAMPSFTISLVQKQTLPNSFLVSDYITLNDCNPADEEYIRSNAAKLQRINKILETANAHVGYRVRDEIIFYMLNNKKSGLLDESVAFDNQIMQKILPRIQGSSESIKKMLDELLKLCESEKYDASTKKINFMIKRYEEDGFTSYWL